MLPYALSLFAFQDRDDVGGWVITLSPRELALVSNIRAMSFADLSLNLNPLDGTSPKLEKMVVRLCYTTTSESMKRQQQVKYEQSHGAKVEITRTSSRCWVKLWATGNAETGCWMCEEGEYH